MRLRHGVNIFMITNLPTSLGGGGGTKLGGISNPASSFALSLVLLPDVDDIAGAGAIRVGTGGGGGDGVACRKGGMIQ